MRREVCMNPWKRKKCGSTDIAVYILYKGRIIPICSKCWLEIAKSSREW